MLLLFSVGSGFNTTVLGRTYCSKATVRKIPANFRSLLMVPSLSNGKTTYKRDMRERKKQRSYKRT
jgi:hypothetical protein